MAQQLTTRNVAAPAIVAATEAAAAQSIADRLRELATQRAISWRGIQLRPPVRKPAESSARR